MSANRRNPGRLSSWRARRRWRLVCRRRCRTSAPDVAFLQAVHPVQRAPVGTGVIAPRTAEREVEVAYRVGGRGVDASQVVAHDLFADQVGLFDVALQVGVARQPCVVLVLPVIAVSVRVERRGVHHPAVVDAVVEDQLVVDLQVVVRLVVVVVDVRAVSQHEGPSEVTYCPLSWYRRP